MRVKCLGSVAAVLMAIISGCGGPDATVDRTEARAVTTRPAATEVLAVSLPADPNLPTYVVVIEPFLMAASGVTSGSVTIVQAVINPGEQIGPGVSAQLVSALQRIGNVLVIDYATYQQNPEKVRSDLKPVERGPFLIKGTVTEFTETSDLSGKGESSGPNPVLNFLPYGAGFVINAVKGSSSSQETKRVGMVGLDVQIISPSSGRILSSFTAEGSFTALDMTTSRTSFGKTKTHTEYASSAIGQAQRIALNKTVLQIRTTLIAQSSGLVVSK